MRAAIDAGTRMLIVNSPSNPTGWVISEDEQRALMAMADEHDLMVLADEVYERFIYDLPAVAWRRRARDIAPSFARAGGRPRPVDRRQQLFEDLQHDRLAPRLGAGERTRHQDDVQGRGVHDLQSRRSGPAGRHRRRCGMARRTFASCATITPLVARQVKAALEPLPGVSLPDPQGAFYAFPRIDAASDSTAFTAALVQKTGVALAPGVGFGRDGEGYIRVCFASTEATVGEALSRLRNFVISGGS